MIKFSKIYEGVNLGSFQITDIEFNQYKNLVMSILNKMYSGKTTRVENMNLIIALPSEQKIGRDFSILNKVNTNVRLMTNFVNKFKLNNFDELKKFIEDNKTDLFTEDGKYYQMVFDTIRSTEKIGEENEELVITYIKNLAISKYNLNDIDIKREATSSERDMIHGIDITFTINDKECTCQVKPLKSWKEDASSFIITSSGRIKKYDTDYIAFVDKYKNEVLLFRNKGISINGESITISKSNYVTY